MSMAEILDELPKLPRSEREKLWQRLEELELAEADESPEMLAALDAGRKSMREGKRHTVEEVRQLLTQWTTR